MIIQAGLWKATPWKMRMEILNLLVQLNRYEWLKEKDRPKTAR